MFSTKLTTLAALVTLSLSAVACTNETGADEDSDDEERDERGATGHGRNPIIMRSRAS
jgi:hypothetical protein